MLHSTLLYESFQRFYRERLSARDREEIEIGHDEADLIIDGVDKGVLDGSKGDALFSLPVERLRSHMWFFFDQVKRERIALADPTFELRKNDLPKKSENVNTLKDGRSPQNKRLCYLHPGSETHWMSKCVLILGTSG